MMEGLMQFGHEKMLWGLLILPVIIALYLLALRRRRRDLDAYGDRELTGYLMPEASVSAYRWKIVLTVIGFALVVVMRKSPASPSTSVTFS